MLQSIFAEVIKRLAQKELETSDYYLFRSYANGWLMHELVSFFPTSWPGVKAGIENYRRAGPEFQMPSDLVYKLSTRAEIRQAFQVDLKHTNLSRFTR